MRRVISVTRRHITFLYPNQINPEEPVMTGLKRLIVTALESVCVVTHRGPLVYLPGRNCKPSNWSMTLDDRWGTGVWKKVPADD